MYSSLGRVLLGRRCFVAPSVWFRVCRSADSTAHNVLTSAIRTEHSGQERNWNSAKHVTALGLLTSVMLWLKNQDSTDDGLSVKAVQCAQVKPPNERQAAIQALNVIADVAEDAQPAVVSVTTADSKRFFSYQSRSNGSGFILDTDGHVITNAHVVGYGARVFVALSDGRSFPGRVTALDVSSDLALIKLDVNDKVARTLPHLSLAKDLKQVRPGHFVLALGSPLMLPNSVTVGVVSALDRDLGHPNGLKYIQTDAIITFGNSGGPLVNLAGEVIGVNAMVAGTGVGFAIPVNQVKKFADMAVQLTAAKATQQNPAENMHIISETSTDVGATPNRRYLGLVMRTLTPELAFEMASRGGPHLIGVTEGVLIHATLRNSPAERAGLQPGDVIVAIDGLPIKSAQEVYNAAENREQLSLTIIRQGKRITKDGIRTEKV